MKALYIFILLSVCNIIFSQTTLTNRQLHNYNVGDTVQYGSPVTYCLASPPTNKERIVIQKQISTNSILYTFKENYNDMYGHYDWNKGTTTYTLQVSNLDSVAKYSEAEGYAMHMSCSEPLRYHDSVYVNSCNKNVNQRHYTLDTNYICRFLGTSKLIEGVGEFCNINEVINGDPCSFGKTLLYFHKVGENPCGNRVNISDAPVPVTKTKLSVYPTVVMDNKINIDYDREDIISLLIYTLDGKLIQQPNICCNIKTFSVNLNSGLYIFKFERENTHEILYKKIIIAE